MQFLCSASDCCGSTLIYTLNGSVLAIDNVFAVYLIGFVYSHFIADTDCALVTDDFCKCIRLLWVYSHFIADTDSVPVTDCL